MVLFFLTDFWFWPNLTCIPLEAQSCYQFSLVILTDADSRSPNAYDIFQGNLRMVLSRRTWWPYTFSLLANLSWMTPNFPYVDFGKEEIWLRALTCLWPHLHVEQQRHLCLQITSRKQSGGSIWTAAGRSDQSRNLKWVNEYVESVYANGRWMECSGCKLSPCCSPAGQHTSPPLAIVETSGIRWTQNYLASFFTRFCFWNEPDVGLAQPKQCWTGLYVHPPALSVSVSVCLMSLFLLLMGTIQHSYRIA